MTTETEFSPSIGALAGALAKAQGRITAALRDRRNPHTGSMYADLANVWAACREPLSSNGLAVVQTTEPHGVEGVCVVTMLLHESGEWVRGRLFLPVMAQARKDGTLLPVNAQSFGSALTYARRYALAALVGIAPDDDDGEQASNPARPGPAKAAAPPPPARSDVDVDALVRGLSEAKNDEEMAKAILAVSRVKEKLSKPDLARCMAARDARVRELEAAAAETAA